MDPEAEVQAVVPHQGAVVPVEEVQAAAGLVEDNREAAVARAVVRVEIRAEVGPVEDNRAETIKAATDARATVRAEVKDKAVVVRVKVALAAALGGVVDRVAQVARQGMGLERPGPRNRSIRPRAQHRPMPAQARALSATRRA